MDHGTWTWGRAALGLLCALAGGACGDSGERVAQGEKDSLCPTCITTAGGETADFGEQADSSPCDTHIAPVTDAVRADYGLSQLAEQLAAETTVEAGWSWIKGDGSGQLPDMEPVPVTFRFELGDFAFLKSDEATEGSIFCDSVRAPVRVHIEVGDGLLSLDAVGSVWKGEGELETHLYARADLARATGSYQLALDESRPHIAGAEMALSIFPGHVRGDVIPFVQYFDDEAEAQAYLAGDPTAYGDLHAQTSFRMPLDACDQHAFPVPMHDDNELLGDRSPATLIEEATGRMTGLLTPSAVWDDDSETAVAIEFDPTRAEVACVAVETFGSPSMTEAAVVVRTAMDGHLQSADGRVDLPLSSLVLTLGRNDLAPWQLLFRGYQLAGDADEGFDGDRLDAEVQVDLTGDAPSLDGFVEVHASSSPTGCMAFPIGGKWDTEHCRSTR